MTTLTTDTLSAADLKDCAAVIGTGRGSPTVASAKRPVSTATVHAFSLERPIVNGGGFFKQTERVN